MFRARTTSASAWRLMVPAASTFAPATSGQPGPLPGPIWRARPPAGDPGHPGGRDPGAGLVLLPAAPIRVDAGRPVLANESFPEPDHQPSDPAGFSYGRLPVPASTPPTLDGPVDYQDYPGEAAPETGTWTEVRERAETVVEAKRDTPFENGHPGLPAQPGVPLQPQPCRRFRPAATSGGASRPEVREGYCEQFAIAMAMMARQSDPRGWRWVSPPARSSTEPSSRSPPTTPTPGPSCGSEAGWAVRADPAGRRHRHAAPYTTPAAG